MNQPKRIAILFSGRGSNMVALTRHILAHPETMQLATLICNRPNAEGIERAREMGFETNIIDNKGFETRAEFDEAVHQALVAANAEMICLAGFMRILTAEFVEKWPRQIINIHPSLLPKYKGLHTHQRALDANDPQHGCSVQFVTPELDAGPVIIQKKIDILVDDTPQSLEQRVLELEHPAYLEALDKLVSS